MPTEAPGSTRNLKGALVILEGAVPVPTGVVIFQYNPETVRRSLGRPRVLGDESEGVRTGEGRSAHPPRESFDLEVALDATDQLEFPAENPLTVADGLRGALAALELLLYPPSERLLLNRVLSAAGASVLRSARAPVVLLVWGTSRVVPVRVESLQVEETAFDARLNPIRADVTLGLETLTLAELREIGGPLGALGTVNHVAREAMARAHGLTSVPRYTAGLF